MMMYMYINCKKHVFVAVRLLPSHICVGFEHHSCCVKLGSHVNVFEILNGSGSECHFRKCSYKTISQKIQNLLNCM